MTWKNPCMECDNTKRSGVGLFYSNLLRLRKPFPLCYAVCVAVLCSNEVPSGLRITGAGARRKMGWMVHGAGVGCNVMRLVRGKGSLLAVQPEAVAGDSNGVDVVAILVRLDYMKMYGQRHCRR